MHRDITIIGLFMNDFDRINTGTYVEAWCGESEFP